MHQYQQTPGPLVLRVDKTLCRPLLIQEAPHFPTRHLLAKARMMEGRGKPPPAPKKNVESLDNTAQEWLPTQATSSGPVQDSTA